MNFRRRRPHDPVGAGSLMPLRRSTRERREAEPVGPSGIPPAPPAYLWYLTCATCWEACGIGWWARRSHHKQWGHEPDYSFYPSLMEAADDSA